MGTALDTESQAINYLSNINFWLATNTQLGFWGRLSISAPPLSNHHVIHERTLRTQKILTVFYHTSQIQFPSSRVHRYAALRLVRSIRFRGSFRNGTHRLVLGIFLPGIGGSILCLFLISYGIFLWEVSKKITSAENQLVVLIKMTNSWWLCKLWRTGKFN